MGTVLAERKKWLIEKMQLAPGWAFQQGINITQEVGQEENENSKQDCECKIQLYKWEVP